MIGGDLEIIKNNNKWNAINSLNNNNMNNVETVKIKYGETGNCVFV